jgi:ornithine carbamoyltransferase
MKLKTKDLLTLEELNNNELSHIIDFGIKLKKELKNGKTKPILKNKTLAMIFQKPSTRTRVSFETGMFQLGGFTYRVENQLKILHAHYHVIQTSLWHEFMTIK